MERTETIQKKKFKTTDRLFALFLKHVGVGNGLTVMETLRAIYGADKIRRMDKFSRFFYWNCRVRPAITRLKIKKRLFIMEMPYKEKRVWFALKSKNELIFFKTKCAAGIDGLQHMQRLADEAYAERWHEQRLKEMEK